MTLSATRLVPEIQHWLQLLIINSAVNKDGIPAPVAIDDTYMPQASFIEMLFNDTYSYNEYKYLYVLKQNKYCMPFSVFNRLQIYDFWRYCYVDTTGENIFSLVSDDITMLNALLQFRIDSTSLTVVDSTTATTLTHDTTASLWILSSSPSILSTPLSKLIYIYLDFAVNGRTTYYNNTTVLGNSVLSCSYEIYVLEKIFAAVTARGY
jgi:hypothetical protein